MHLLPLLAWASWAVLAVLGLCLCILRSTETGLAYVNLPRLAYFFWILVCVMLMASLKAPEAAAGGLIAAFCVGLYALVGDEPVRGGRERELVERAEGCRRALKENERNPASLELLGDAYSTIEDGTLALRHWERSYVIFPNAKLLEKMERVKRERPVFHYWGEPCARELRACQRCERIGSRRAFACPGCGQAFYPDRASWLASRFNALWEADGAGRAVETGVALLPFLFWCAPWAYGLAWLCWTGARREGPESDAPGAAGGQRGRVVRRMLAILILLSAWSVRAGFASAPSITWPGKDKPAPGRPARVSAKVSWTTTP